LDSSVPLAILFGEVTNRSTYGLIDGAVMSAVNLAEVYSKVSELHATGGANDATTGARLR